MVTGAVRTGERLYAAEINYKDTNKQIRYAKQMLLRQPSTYTGNAKIVK